MSTRLSETRRDGLLFHPCNPRDALDIYFDKNYWCVQYKDKQIFFTFSQRGKAISAHFSASRKDLREIRGAIENFINWIYTIYPWCEMIMATITKPSVKRLVERIGFDHVCDAEGKSVYVRAR